MAGADPAGEPGASDGSDSARDPRDAMKSFLNDYVVETPVSQALLMSVRALGEFGIPELVNLQDVDGKAKPYQVRQALKLVDRYNLTLGGES